VPASYAARGHDEGKKLTSADGLKVIATLLRCRFTPAAAKRGAADFGEAPAKRGSPRS